MIVLLAVVLWCALSVPASLLAGRFIAVGSKSTGGTSSTGEWSSRRRSTHEGSV